MTAVISSRLSISVGSIPDPTDFLLLPEQFQGFFPPIALAFQPIALACNTQAQCSCYAPKVLSQTALVNKPKNATAHDHKEIDVIFS